MHDVDVIIDPGPGGSDELIDDDELAAEAVAADPNPDLADAIPFAVMIGGEPRAALPEWYMPAPMSGAPRLVGWRRNVVFLFIASLIVIEAAGLCTTYGRLS